MKEITWSFAAPGALEDYSSDWNALVAEAGYPGFMRAEAVAVALEAFSIRQGQLVLGWRGDRLAAGAVLQRQTVGRWQTFQPSQMPLGCWIMNGAETWEGTLPRLIQAIPGTCMSLGITQQDPWLTRRPVGLKCIEDLDYVTTAWIDVRGTFEEFWSACSKNLRQNLRKQRRKLEELGGAVTFEFLEADPDLSQGFNDYCLLEGSGWKAKEGTAVAIDDLQGYFYGKLLKRMAGDRVAFLARLCVGGRPVAANFGIRDGVTLVILKTTYDEELKGFSPGQLLHESLFQYLFGGQGIARIEFYGRVMEWHLRWTDKTRTLYHVNAFRSVTVRRIRARLGGLLRGSVRTKK